MKMPKPSAEDKDYFRSIVPDHPAVEVKPMFGNVAAFVNGNMFMGLFGPAVGLRLGESERGKLLTVAGSGPFGPEERPMKEYVSLPASWRTEPSKTASWVEKALDHTAALPPKGKK
ncbi:MAG: TfoX/Sxy family protein [Acidimicrobiia bacterium]|nr:TfoX/Sxy family protein [Acidimicrobiia bacterium]